MRRTEDRHESLSAIQETVKPEGFYAVLCYSPREMAQDQPVKALVIALTGHAAAAVYTINRLQPDSLCFVLPEGAKALVESEVQPKIEHLPRRWDWVVLPEIGEFVGCYQTLARTLPEMLRTWEVQPGELVVDVTGATSAMAGALTLVTMPMSSRIVSLVPAREGQEDDMVDIAGQPFIWTQGNPWDEAASISRREGCELFNRRLFAAATKLFREVEARVSGGQKPLYRAFSDLADGYDLWERFHYRQAWEKLKTAVKAFEMAALWGGPPGLTSLLPAIKVNAGFLERLVLDPAPVKDMQALDLLAHAGADCMVCTIRKLPWSRSCARSKPLPRGNCSNNTRSKPGTCSRSNCRKRCKKLVDLVGWKILTASTNCPCRRSFDRWLD